MSTSVKLRCNRKVVREESGKIVTERTFISTDREGKQMNGKIVNATYSDTIIDDAEDTSLGLNSSVTFSLGDSGVVEKAKTEPASNQP